MKEKINRKRYFGIFLLLLIMWISLSGQYMSASLAGEISEDWVLPCFIQFLITIIIMTIVPGIFCLMNHGRIENKKGKRICLFNSIILLILSIVLGLISGKSTLFIGGLGAVLFYLINKWAFVYYQDEPVDNSKKEKVILKEEVKKEKIKLSKKSLKFKKTETLSVVLLILLMLSIILNIYLSTKKDSAKNEPTTDDKCMTFTSCFFEYSDEITKAEFLDENIVFVIDGYGNNYYTYDCMQKVTNGNEYSYRAYNEKMAISNGYSKGSCD